MLPKKLPFFLTTSSFLNFRYKMGYLRIHNWVKLIAIPNLFKLLFYVNKFQVALTKYTERKISQNGHPIQMYVLFPPLSLHQFQIPSSYIRVKPMNWEITLAKSSKSTKLGEIFFSRTSQNTHRKFDNVLLSQIFSFLLYHYIGSMIQYKDIVAQL